MEKEIFSPIHRTLNELSTKRKENVDLDARLRHLQMVVEKLKEYDFLSDGQVDEALVKAQEKKVDTFLLMKDVLEKVQQETGHFHDLVEMGFYTDLINYNWIEPEIQGQTLEWGNDKMKGRGHYVTKQVFGKGKIELRKEAPKPEEVVSDLAKTGYLPKVIGTLGHEIVHSYQTTGQLRELPSTVQGLLAQFTENLRSVQSNGELKEAQAHRFNHPIEKKNTKELSDKIVTKRTFDKSRLMYDGFVKEKIDYGVKAVDYLSALGLDVQEISGLISHHGGWDEETQTYRSIEKRIKEEMQKKGLSKEELDKLVQVDSAERAVEREKARIVIHEELKKFLLKNKVI